MAPETRGHAPDALILRLHRYVWQPARYAHPAWLHSIGFHPGNTWQYGRHPAFDRCLDHTLQARRGTPSLPGRLTARQQRWVRLSPNMTAYALALGLVQFGCGEYFLLPDYRKVISPWLDDALIWQLFGLCGRQRDVIFSPDALVEAAVSLGSCTLYRVARGEPVLYSLLLGLPPTTRALWPPVPIAAMHLLERVLCPCADYP